MLSHTSHKFTAKKPMTRLHASSLMFCQDNREIECLTCRQAVQLRDILSDLETCLTQDYCQDARNKIACKLSHLLSRMSMSRLSDFETGL